MRAMILAAGRGDRMRPLTDVTPKPLLQVNGQALIEYHILALAHAGIKDLVINHAHLGHMIPAALGDGSRYGVKIQYSDEGTALETAGGIFHAMPLLGKDPFIVINGDVWTNLHFASLLDKPQGLAHLVMVPNPPQHPNGDFTINEQTVINQKGVGSLTFSGIGVYHPDLFKDCKPGKFPLAPLLIKAMEQQLVTGERYDGLWYDIGTPERLLAIDKILSSGELQYHHKAFRHSRESGNSGELA